MVVVATFGRHRKESWSLLLSDADAMCEGLQSQQDKMLLGY